MSAAPLPPVSFNDVKTVLDDLITAWSAGNGGAPDLKGAHGASFGWATKAELLAATAKQQRLIQPEIIGKPNLGRTANLVIDLTTGLTVGARTFPAMPLGGLDSSNDKYLDPNGPEITTIVNWIEGGCHD